MRNLAFVVGVLATLATGQAIAKQPLSLAELVSVGEQKLNPDYNQPVTTDQDLQDDGKSFEVVCKLSNNGRLKNCKAKAEHITDKAFVNMVILSAQDWSFETRTRKGRNAVGQKVRFVAKVLYK